MTANAPETSFPAAEGELLRRRARPADMDSAVTEALAEACGAPVPAPYAEAGRLIAAAVTAHGASFPAGHEPEYHDRHHQSEATLAMGWLCGAARRRGALDAPAAGAGVLAMAGHDLRHDGTVPPAGTLEARAAALTAALAAQAGLGPDVQQRITRTILATDPARAAAGLDEDDLLCRLAREADLFASLTPRLGWQLSKALAREFGAAGHHPAPAPDCFAGRLALLQARPSFTGAAEHLGVAAGVAAQLAAFARLGAGDPARGAMRLDALPPAQAMAEFQAALAAA